MIDLLSKRKKRKQQERRGKEVARKNETCPKRNTSLKKIFSKHAHAPLLRSFLLNTLSWGKKS